MAYSQEAINAIRDRIAHLKRQKATRPNFGKKKSKDKDGFTADQRKEFKQWVDGENEKEEKKKQVCDLCDKKTGRSEMNMLSIPKDSDKPLCKSCFTNELIIMEYEEEEKKLENEDVKS